MKFYYGKMVYMTPPAEAPRPREAAESQKQKEVREFAASFWKNLYGNRIMNLDMHEWKKMNDTEQQREIGKWLILTDTFGGGFKRKVDFMGDFEGYEHPKTDEVYKKADMVALSIAMHAWLKKPSNIAKITPTPEVTKRSDVITESGSKTTIGMTEAQKRLADSFNSKFMEKLSLYTSRADRIHTDMDTGRESVVDSHEVRVKNFAKMQKLLNAYLKPKGLSVTLKPLRGIPKYDLKVNYESGDKFELYFKNKSSQDQFLAELKKVSEGFRFEK